MPDKEHYCAGCRARHLFYTGRYIRFPDNEVLHLIWQQRFHEYFQSDVLIAKRARLCDAFYNSELYNSLMTLYKDRRPRGDRPVPTFVNRGLYTPDVHPESADGRRTRKRHREDDQQVVLKRQKTLDRQKQLQALDAKLADLQNQFCNLPAEIAVTAAAAAALRKKLGIEAPNEVTFSILDKPVTPSPITLDILGRFKTWFGASDINFVKDLATGFIQHPTINSKTYNSKISVGDCILLCLLRLRRGSSYKDLESMTGFDRRRISEAVHALLPLFSEFLKGKCQQQDIENHYPPICRYV